MRSGSDAGSDIASGETGLVVATSGDVEPQAAPDDDRQAVLKLVWRRAVVHPGFGPPQVCLPCRGACVAFEFDGKAIAIVRCGPSNEGSGTFKGNF